MTAATSDRLEWVDATKGVGIILVVVAHALIGVDPTDVNGRFIYLFHMPLFFMLSAYLQNSRPARPFLARKTASLLRPYIAFLTVLSLPLALRAGFAVINNLPLPMVELGALLDGGQHLSGIHGVFWFVTCLFVAQVAFNVLLNKLRPESPAMLGIMAALAGAGSALHVDLPWNLSAVPIAVVFLWLGSLLRSLPFTPSSLIALAASIALICASIALGEWPSFDMKPLNFGTPIVGVLIAAGLSCGVIVVVRGLGCFRALSAGLTYVGSASMTIMYLHLVGLRVAGYVTDNLAVAVVFGGLALPLAAHVAIGTTPILRYIFRGQSFSSPLPART
jgi:fucose 4-O-acetylase-like acetyltransferase